MQPVINPKRKQDIESLETRGSTVFSAVQYNVETHELLVDFLGSGAYLYHMFPPAMWEWFKMTSSYGLFFNTYIKPNYQFTRIRHEQSMRDLPMLPS